MTTDATRLIRKAVEADQPRIHAIRMAVRENILSDPSKVTAEEVAWYRDNAIFLVAESAGEIAGFACANHQTGLVWALFVDPAQEGGGHGRALLDAALAGLKAAGHAQAWLETGAGTRAERFYRRHGWHDRGRGLDGQIVFTRQL
ncbi:N-acetylglutamate synthase-like GNAT family acetyltransferase [Bosea sp. AK1]|uniref:GNAT family N-acetyltransferase n=1 Tax=Bosea sp. AK1 TaxID=2587160 RepID=UPI0011754B0D|nr:GNAT family N-acetyltransferase [Bosea sp. AK1]TQI73127.1 N-acetylglutamate synthase-like GNAT family acetyltransferase [Bosea sp. AK1]